MAGLAYEPVSYYLKDALGLGPGEAAAFVAWMTLPLTLKPLLGLVTDLLPWRGRRRAPHLAAVSILTGACWLGLSALRAPSYGAALALLVLVNVGFVLGDVVVDGVMVERGRETGRTGRYQAVQIGTLYVTLVVTGLGGGWLAQHAPYRAAFLLAAVFPLLTACSAPLIGDGGALRVVDAASRGWGALREAFSRRESWALAGGVFLWSFAPMLGTAQFYHQSGPLGLSPLFIGGLSTAAGVAGVAGAALYPRLGRDAAGLARLSILAGAPLSLLYLFYRGPEAVLALTVLFGLTGVLFRLAWMELAARACPPGAEATVFAAYMAVFNLSASLSNALGGALYGRLADTLGPHGAWSALSLLSSAAMLCAWPLLRAASGPKS